MVQQIRYRSEDETRLREKAVTWLRHTYPGHRIIHELNLDRGDQRLDLAAVSSEQIVLVELKSDSDVTVRLPDQLRAALSVGDLVWVAAGVHHETDLVRSSALPHMVGLRIESADGLCSTPIQVKARRSILDPTPILVSPHAARPNFPDPRALARLLWVDELTSCLGHAGFATRGSNHASLVQKAVTELTGRELKQWVCAALRARTFANADAPIPLIVEKAPNGWGRPKIAA